MGLFSWGIKAPSGLSLFKKPVEESMMEMLTLTECETCGERKYCIEWVKGFFKWKKRKFQCLNCADKNE